MKGCISCGAERDAPAGKGRYRTRCKKCWNEYCANARIAHLSYYATYMRTYNKERRESDPYFKESTNRSSNKSNKKAIFELKPSYLKNRVADGKRWQGALTPLIDVKKMIIEIHRWTKKK